MPTKLVMLNDKDHREVTRRLRNKGSALISTRRTVVNETDETLAEILAGDTLVLCAMVGIKPSKTVCAIENNREPNDPNPTFIRCVPCSS